MVFSLLTITHNNHFEWRTPLQKMMICPTLPARKLIFNTCAGLIASVKNIITSNNFIDRNHPSGKKITWQRELPFHVMMTFLIHPVKNSCQDEPDIFFKTPYRLDVTKRVVLKVILIKAWIKLKFQTLIELNAQMTGAFKRHFNTITWFDFRLLAMTPVFHVKNGRLFAIFSTTASRRIASVSNDVMKRQ